VAGVSTLAFVVSSPTYPPQDPCAQHVGPMAKEACMDRDTLVDKLMAENEEFRRLRTEHRDHDRELETLRGYPSLSAEQQWRATELKKLKLMAKDRMETIIRHVSARVTA
jgi:uncharacterized protein YdcH (DUF465 family)